MATINYNFFLLKILYVLVFTTVGIFWETYKSIPLNFFSFAAVLWALNLYRILNRDKTTIQNEFFFSFWVRMGWATTYSLYSTGKLYPDSTTFLKNLTEWFLTTLIYTGIPLRWVDWLWSIRVFRWMVFIVDQPTANAYSYLPLFKK